MKNQGNWLRIIPLILDDEVGSILLGILMLLIGSSSISSFFGVSLLVSGFISFKFSRNYLRDKFKITWNSAEYSVLLTLIILIGSVMSIISTVRAGEYQRKEAQKEFEMQQQPVELVDPSYSIGPVGRNKELQPEQNIKVIQYVESYQTTIRYDNAPSILVLIDPIPKFTQQSKVDIKNLITKICSDHSQKCNIEIFSNETALNLYKQSHYLDNTLGRLITKKENKFLAKFNIASYAGEMETMQNFYDLMYFPFAENCNCKWEKHFENEAFKP